MGKIQLILGVCEGDDNKCIFSVVVQKFNYHLGGKLLDLKKKQNKKFAFVGLGHLKIGCNEVETYDKELEALYIASIFDA